MSDPNKTCQVCEYWISPKTRTIWGQCFKVEKLGFPGTVKTHGKQTCAHWEQEITPDTLEGKDS